MTTDGQLMDLLFSSDSEDRRFVKRSIISKIQKTPNNVITLIPLSVNVYGKQRDKSEMSISFHSIHQL